MNTNENTKQWSKEEWIKSAAGSIVYDAKLPSQFQPGDYCYLRLSNNSYLGSTVTAVKFTKSMKSLYDLDVDIDLGSKKSSTTRIHGIDEKCLVSIEYFENEVVGRQIMREGDLSGFGRYILSDERTKWFTDNYFSDDNISLKERLQEVYHSDIENWKKIKEG